MFWPGNPADNLTRSAAAGLGMCPPGSVCLHHESTRFPLCSSVGLFSLSTCTSVPYPCYVPSTSLSLPPLSISLYVSIYLSIYLPIIGYLGIDLHVNIYLPIIGYLGIDLQNDQEHPT